ncbi:ABC transporter permease [Salipiger sp. P9]|uniref:ABC transporter permease n=1 Tax=Salipiger pentaromativorans TaxID=2943193 RepID=UPI0021574500|nr:ABC transporter permease [Salipiger pentaromativorans]MCR8548393.1 ABC transporter permease [Salipiger pentaromativorans]
MVSLPAPDSRAPLALHRLTGFVLGRIGVMPALLTVGVFVLLPCLWLVWLSVLDRSGALSGENYARLIEQASYRRIFLITFRVSFETVLCCLVLGIPFASYVAKLPPRAFGLVMAAVLFPLWTSLLVRAYAWLVILQRNGLLNTWLQDWGLIDAPLPLAFNEFATVLGMTHIMLPIFLLPTISAMRSVDGNLLKASESMGASGLRTYLSVFLPLSLSGILAGTILVFVMSLGFYVTPAILGGGNVQVISMRIARSLSTYSNFGASSAIGVVLLICVFAVLGLSLLLRRRLSGGKETK